MVDGCHSNQEAIKRIESPAAPRSSHMSGEPI